MNVVLFTIIVVITSNLIRICCALSPAARFNRFFFWLSMGRHWAIRTLNFKEVSYEIVNLHNHCSDKLEPNSKDTSEYAVLCSLLRGWTDFFFLALQGNAFSYHNFEIERSQYCKWYVPRTLNSSFYFPKASCNCWKRFPAYTFPIARFVNEQFCPLEVLSQDSERTFDRLWSVGRQSEARQSLGQYLLT